MAQCADCGAQVRLSDRFTCPNRCHELRYLAAIVRGDDLLEEDVPQQVAAIVSNQLRTRRIAVFFKELRVALRSVKRQPRVRVCIRPLALPRWRGSARPPAATLRDPRAAGPP